MTGGAEIGDTCEAMRLLAQAELDGELDAAGAAALAAHIASCPDCAGLQRDLADLSGRLHAGLPRHAAPPALRRAVLTQAARTSARSGMRVSWRDGGWFGAGAALAASVAMLVVLTQTPGTDAPAAEAVAAHIRALQPGHLLDVPSTDQHTVKPWFDGRLDFAPPVADLAAQGFPLVGGRLDYLAGRPVAALVYRHGKHLIDLFVWPGQQPASYQSVQGYNVQGWSQGGMNFRTASDLNPVELADFKKLLLAAGG